MKFSTKSTTSRTIYIAVVAHLLVAYYDSIGGGRRFAHGFAVKESVSTLLQKHASDITRLKEETQAIVGNTNIDNVPYNNDVFYLRYCINEGSSTTAAEDLKTTLAWRQGQGKAICDAAVAAFAQATTTTTKDGKWNNDPVRDAAPNADQINQYITPSTTLTTTSSQGDLVYCIRAGLIDDKALMASLSSVDQLVDFFLYCKEINALVANDRSLDQDRLVTVITVNDLNGLQLIGGDATFRQALSAASKQANKLYPALSGPTLLLNLPVLLSAIVKLFTPLFPPEVNARLKFERGPLKDVQELLDVTHGGKDRASFLQDLDALCYPPTNKK
jgi:CRAL/TRIO domain